MNLDNIIKELDNKNLIFDLNINNPTYDEILKVFLQNKYKIVKFTKTSEYLIHKDEYDELVIDNITNIMYLNINFIPDNLIDIISNIKCDYNVDVIFNNNCKLNIDIDKITIPIYYIYYSPIIFSIKLNEKEDYYDMPNIIKISYTCYCIENDLRQQLINDKNLFINITSKDEILFSERKFINFIDV